MTSKTYTLVHDFCRQKMANDLDGLNPYALKCWLPFTERVPIIKAVYDEKDVFMWLPTGFGKSICYTTSPFAFNYSTDSGKQWSSCTSMHQNKTLTSWTRMLCTICEVREWLFSSQTLCISMGAYVPQRETTQCTCSLHNVCGTYAMYVDAIYMVAFLILLCKSKTALAADMPKHPVTVKWCSAVFLLSLWTTQRKKVGWLCGGQSVQEGRSGRATWLMVR